MSGAGSRMKGEIGNGRATAILLARQGAKVALVDHNVDWAANTKEMIDAEGGIAEVIQADVTDEESCRRAVARTVELYGTVHILVNIGMWPGIIVPTEKERLTPCVHSWGWRRDGRRYEGGYGCLGPRHANQRHVDGPNVAACDSRDA